MTATLFWNSLKNDDADIEIISPHEFVTEAFRAVPGPMKINSWYFDGDGWNSENVWREVSPGHNDYGHWHITETEV